MLKSFLKLFLASLVFTSSADAGPVTMAVCYAGCAAACGMCGGPPNPLSIAAYAACQQACTVTLVSPSP